MARYEFKLPDIGEGVTEGEIVSWAEGVAVGADIKADQALVEVMTDKATVTITSPKAGKVTELGGKAGTVIPVGKVLAVLDVQDAAQAPSHAPARVETKAEPAPAPAPAPAPEAKPATPAATAVGRHPRELAGNAAHARAHGTGAVYRRAPARGTRDPQARPRTGHRPSRSAGVRAEWPRDCRRCAKGVSSPEADRGTDPDAGRAHPCGGVGAPRRAGGRTHSPARYPQADIRGHGEGRSTPPRTSPSWRSATPRGSSRCAIG